MSLHPIQDRILEWLGDIPNIESIFEWTFLIISIITLASITIAFILFCVVQYVYSSPNSLSKKKDIHNKDHFVIFIDLSVIVDCDHAFTQSLISALSEFGIQVTESKLFFKNFLGRGEGEAISEAISQFSKSKNKNENNENKTTQIRQKSSEFYQEFLKNGKIRPKEGVLKMLNNLNNNIKILVSSFDQRRIKETLKHMHIRIAANSFDMIVSGDSLPRKKPLPDIYTLTAHKMGVLPSQCLVVEHTPTGILAAKNAGMYCFGVENGTFSAKDLGMAGADKILLRVTDLSSSIEVFEKEKLKLLSSTSLNLSLKDKDKIKITDALSTDNHITNRKKKK